jgi:hypothetical protein
MLLAESAKVGLVRVAQITGWCRVEGRRHKMFISGSGAARDRHRVLGHSREIISRNKDLSFHGSMRQEAMGIVSRNRDLSFDQSTRQKASFLGCTSIEVEHLVSWRFI